MRQVSRTTFALALLAAAIGQAYAQSSTGTTTAADDKDKEFGSQKVTITTGSRSAKAIDKIPGAVTVITKDEIQHTLAVTEDATAVLTRTVPGYSESSQAMSNSGETLRGRIALRLFDGIPQGSPLREGTRNGSFTDMGLIGRIEVINGPSASEGIGAAGGIINYISLRPTRPGTNVTLTTRYGSQFEDDSANWKVGLTATHLQDQFDILAAVSHIDRGMTYDGNGRAIGLNTSGSVADSKANNVYLRGGINFGRAETQRLQASYSHFRMAGKGNYRLVDGDRATGTTNTSVRGALFGSKTELNDFEQSSLTYTHNDFYAGVLTATAYRADQAMRYPAEDGDDRQDPLIAPLGTLVDQSEIRSKKTGLRTEYARRAAFGFRDLELRLGVDLTKDVVDQRLALTDRLWVPPMDYRSTAPWIQLSYDIGPVTLSGGFRREDGELQVDSYTTTYFRNRVFVEGGKLDYQSDLPNLGVVWRLAPDWSVFASASKGFTLPNVGIPLRNVNKPGQSVQGILDLQAIEVDNTEVGFNWRGAMAGVSGSYYHSKSDFGVSLLIDPVTNDFVMRRLPTDIKGFELSGDIRPTKALKLSALYSRIRGKTEFTPGGPLDKEMGINDISPDKIGVSASWKPVAQAEVTLGATKLLSRDINEGKSGEEHTRGYTLFDLSANVDFGRNGKLTLGVENLTDKFYILSWSQVVGFRNYWAGRGRVVTLTHTITF